MILEKTNRNTPLIDPLIINSSIKFDTAGGLKLKEGNQQGQQHQELQQQQQLQEQPQQQQLQEQQPIPSLQEQQQQPYLLEGQENEDHHQRQQKQQKQQWQLQEQGQRFQIPREVVLLIIAVILCGTIIMIAVCGFGYRYLELKELELKQKSEYMDIVNVCAQQRPQRTVKKGWFSSETTDTVESNVCKQILKSSYLIGGSSNANREQLSSDRDEL